MNCFVNGLPHVLEPGTYNRSELLARFGLDPGNRLFSEFRDDSDIVTVADGETVHFSTSPGGPVGGHFDVGDLVFLNSGGPEMTVAGDLMPNGRLLCLWFDEGGMPMQATFPAAALTLSELVDKDDMEMTE